MCYPLCSLVCVGCLQPRDGHASLSARRVPAAGVVTLLARGEAAGGSGSGSGRGGSGASWLRGLLR